MFVYLKYFVLIICFNDCCGASNLIPTAIYSSPQRYQQIGHHINAGPVRSDATQYYPVYSLPLGANPSPGELQYSSSMAQPTIEMSRERANMVNFRSSLQKQINSQKPVESRRQNFGQSVEPNNLPKVRYVPSRTNPRVPALQYNRQPLSVSTSLQTPKSVNQKPMIPMMFRHQMSGNTSKPSILYKLDSTLRSLDTNRGPKSELNPSPAVRVQSLRFNWPKNKPQTQQNVTQIRPIISEEMSRTQLSNQQKNNQNGLKKQVFSESQQNFRYDSNNSSETTEIPVMQTEILRESTTALPIETTFATTSMATETLKEEASDSDKKEVSSDDLIASNENNQAQSYHSYKLSEGNYEQSGQNGYEIPQFGSPKTENTGAAIPENEVNYEHPEAQPEPEIGGQYTHYASDPYEKDSGYESVDENDSPQLKTLLEQFIQQLDLLKFVAAKELQKTNGLSLPYSSDGKVIHQTQYEPSVSKTGTTYDEYQNERSFEQNLSNTETKAYKDTKDNYGGVGGGGRGGRYYQNYFDKNENYSRSPPTFFISSIKPNINNCSQNDSKFKESNYNRQPLFLSTSNSEQKLHYDSYSNSQSTKTTDEPIVSDITLSFE